jgi:hypothetical protein
LLQRLHDRMPVIMARGDFRPLVPHAWRFDWRCRGPLARHWVGYGSLLALTDQCRSAGVFYFALASFASVFDLGTPLAVGALDDGLLPSELPTLMLFVT